jgi:hypothetical protein
LVSNTATGEGAEDRIWNDLERCENEGEESAIYQSINPSMIHDGCLKVEVERRGRNDS